MSVFSLSACSSNGTGSSSCLTSQNEVLPFDKCVKCLVPFDFIRRRHSSSKVPLILNCKHILCEECIRRLVLSETGVICPLCGKKSEASRDQADNLIEIFIPHYSLIGYLMWNKSDTTATTNANDLNLVSTGVTLRQKQNLFTSPNDTLSSVEVSPEDNDNEQEVTPNEFTFSQCPEHAVGCLNIKCVDCDVIMCAYCFLENHSGHKISNFYKLEDHEKLELNELLQHARVVLSELRSSQKKLRQLKNCDVSIVDADIRSYFANFHARLHLIERRLRDKLSKLQLENMDLEELNASIKSAIRRVSRALSVGSINEANVNVRRLFDELKELVEIPCQIINNEASIYPVEFVRVNEPEEIEDNFDIQKVASTIQYELVSIENWESVTFKVPEQAPVKKDLKSLPRPSSCRGSVSKAKKVPKEDVQLVVVTHVNSLNSFFVQKVSVQDTLKTMNKHLGRKGKTNLGSQDLLLGRMFAVMYQTKNGTGWRRGKLLEIKDTGLQVLYHVFYVDFGSSQSVTKDKLKELDLSTSRRPPCALECKLTNPDKIDFDENAHFNLVQIINEKEIYLKTIKKANNVHEVDLLIHDTSGRIVSVREVLANWGDHVSSDSGRELEILPSRPVKLFKNSKILMVSQEEKAVVSFVRDPFCVCVQMEQNLGVIKKMRNEMTNFYENNYVSCLPVEDTDVIVKYHDEYHGDWHRAKIVSVDAKHKLVDVYFVDWGHTAAVSWSSIRTLIENFTKVECQCIEVKLTHIQPKADQWSERTVDYLKKELFVGKSVRMVVSNVEPLEVAIFISENIADLCLNALLVENNLAISTGNISYTVSWPHHSEVDEIPQDDNDLSSNIIKQSQDALMSYDDPEIKMGAKQQISIVRFENPNLIHIKFKLKKDAEDELHKNLQIHYASDEKQRKKKWKTDECCVIFDYKKKSYYRAKIRTTLEEGSKYAVYLYDQGRDLQVKKEHVFIIDGYFQTIPPFCFKCGLAGVKPAGGSDKWPILANEILQKIFTTYKTIYIRAAESSNPFNKNLEVFMWYMLTICGGALEPPVSKLIPINRVLVESGVAFSNSNRSTVKDSSDESMEKLETQSDNGNQSLDWNDVIAMDEAESSSEGNEEILPANVSTWPDYEKIEESEFDAVVTCVCNDGLFCLRNEDFKLFYKELEDNLKAKFKDLKNKNNTWKVGEMCTIHYDGLWYRGTVLEITSKETVNVEMIDFGSTHDVNIKDLYKQTMYIDLPPLIYKVKLYDVYPKDGFWREADLDALLDIAEDDVKVSIMSGLDHKIPFAEIHSAEDGSSLNNAIVSKCPHLTRLNKSNVDEGSFQKSFKDYEKEGLDMEQKDEDLLNDSLQSSTTEEEELDYVYAALPEVRNRRTKVFLVNVLKYNEVVVNVLNKNPSETSDDVKSLTEEIQTLAETRPSLKKIDLNALCICRKNNSNLWYRAKIHNIDSRDYGFVLAYFVDYGVIDMVNVKDLKEMKPEWLKVPVYNIVAFVNIKLTQESSEGKQVDFVMMQMSGLCGKSFTIEVTSERPLRVHLYDKKKLIYQNLLDGKIVKKF